MNIQRPPIRRGLEDIKTVIQRHKAAMNAPNAAPSEPPTPTAVSRMPRLSVECREQIKIAQAGNRLVFLKQPAPLPGGCENCGGWGKFWLQIAIAGPYQSPPGGKDVVTFWEGDQRWYKVDSRCYACPVCDNPAERLRYLWSSCGLEEHERNWRIDHIAGLPGKERGYNSARDIISTLPRPAGWLIYYGDYGVGKSGLLKSVVAACIRAGVAARYVRAADILAEIRASYGGEFDIREENILREYGSLQLLAVDEIDRISSTPWAQSTLMALMDTRYDRRETCATLMATNLDPSNMSREYGYLQSRMKDGLRVPVGGQELRG